ncbi:MAG: CBS domain-containing protein [Sedimentisphaerales bacterium]
MFETKNFMTTNVVFVKRHTPINTVLKIMMESDITGLPVVNDDMTLVGIISEKDLLRLSSCSEDDPAKVEDFMTENVVSFEQEEDFVTICECLLQNNFRRVPITADGKLVGIVSRKDIIKYILKPL